MPRVCPKAWFRLSEQRKTAEILVCHAVYRREIPFLAKNPPNFRILLKPVYASLMWSHSTYRS